MTLRQESKGIYTDSGAGIDEIDTIIFDCDGVLIDITKSYNQTIIKTARYVLENFAKINDVIDVDFKIIDGFKSTGGFNDEVDLTYAAIISLVAADRLGKDQTDFIFNVIDNADSSGIISVERYLEGRVDCTDIKKQLSFPGTHKENTLYQIFDQLFYGPELYQKLSGNPSQFSEPGLIKRDDVILNGLLLEKLWKKFGSRIAIVTGRGRESASYSLKTLLDNFDLENSVFLEDESRDLAKPNPQSLLDAIKGMNGTSTMFVGDSMEDFIMAKKASDLGYKTIFCGIIGTSENPLEKLELFGRNGAVLALDSINLLPKVLNLE